MRAKRKVTVLISLLAGMCLPLAAQSTRSTYLYALEDSSATNPLHVYSVNPSTGDLTEVSSSPFSAGQSPADLVVDPTGRYVYVINSLSNDITAYAVSSGTGNLTPVPGSPFSTGPDPVAISVDPTGRFLYVSSFDSPASGPAVNALYGYSIDNASGALAALPGFPLALPNLISSLRFDPYGNFAYAAEGEAMPILIYRLNLSTGMLTQVKDVLPATSAAYRTAVDPFDRFFYATQPELAGRVDAFSIDPQTGNITETSNSPYSVGASPKDLAIDPSGKFLYAVNFNSQFQTTNLPSDYAGSISGFTIDPQSGELIQMAGSPFAAGINPVSAVIDPTGHFLYAYASDYPDSASNLSYASILGYSLDSATGIPAPLLGSPWRSGRQYSNGNRLAISYGPSTASNPVPMISSISPASNTTGSGDFTLEVDGVNFVPGAIVYFGGLGRQTTFVSSTQLQAHILAGDVASGGTDSVYVFNPLPDGGLSASVEFNVYNPAPVITSISPSSATAGSSSFTLAVNGSNFISNSTVNFNGTPRATTFVSGAQLTIEVSSTDIASQGTASISVTNPSSNGVGGGTSNSVTLTVLSTGIQPAVSALSPASALVGGPGFALTITGSGFVSGSVVSFDLADVPTTYVSSTQLTAQIPASAITEAGYPVVVVTNPGSTVSLVATFTVNNPPPGVGAISPSSVSAGSGALPVTIDGSSFTDASVVLVNGSPRSTAFVSATQLNATLLPSDFATGGTLNLAVSNPSPGGGTSSAAPLAVTDFTITPASRSSSVSAGQPASYTIAVAPTGGSYNGAVTLTATNLPPMATATFSPSAMVTPGSASVNVTMSITTTAHSGIPAPGFPFGAPGGPSAELWLFLLAAFGLGLAALRWPRRTRKLVPELALACVLLLASGLAACGGAAMGGTSSTSTSISSSAGTPAGTYTVVVTATSGGDSHSTTVTLTVN